MTKSVLSNNWVYLFKSKYWKHLLIILLFVGAEMPIYLSESYRGSSLKLVIIYVSNIGFVYFSRYVVIPKAKGEKWSFYSVIFLAGFLLLYVPFAIFIGQSMNYLTFQPMIPISYNVIMFTALRGGYLFGLSLLFYFQGSAFEKEKKAKKINQAFQRSQINQHLLFNSLHFIHVSTQSVSEALSDAVLTLADIMRYSLRQSRYTDEVPITDEVEQMERYVHLNQILNNNRLNIDFTTSLNGDFKEIKIPSLLLVNLLENVFKHGELGIPEKQAMVRLMVTRQEIYFRIENHKGKYPHPISEHFGLQNTHSRLKEAYGKKYSLIEKNRDNFYILELFIRL